MLVRVFFSFLFLFHSTCRSPPPIQFFFSVDGHTGLHLTLRRASVCLDRVVRWVGKFFSLRFCLNQSQASMRAMLSSAFLFVCRHFFFVYRCVCPTTLSISFSFPPFTSSSNINTACRCFTYFQCRCKYKSFHRVPFRYSRTKKLHQNRKKIEKFDKSIVLD